MDDAEFVIGIGKDDDRTFTVYDGSASPARSPRVRAALEAHRDLLRRRLRSLEEILDDDTPERAQSVMADGVFARVERLALRPRADRDARRISLAIETLAKGLGTRKISDCEPSDLG